MKIRPSLIVLAFALVLPRGDLSGQQHPRVDLGSRVRVATDEAASGTFRDPRWVVGTVRESNDQQVVLRVEGQGDQSALTIPWTAVQRMEISRGTLSSSRSAARVVVPAMGVGAVVGAVFTRLAKSAGRHSKAPIARYAAFGAGIGGLAGLATSAGRREIWEPLDTGTATAGLVMHDGEAGVALRIRF